MKMDNDKGQLTIEFAVVAPIAIMLAVVVAVLLMFVSEVVAFDIAARNVIVKQADKSVDEISSQAVVLEISEATGLPSDRISVDVQRNVLGHVRYETSLRLGPEAYGLSNISIFGMTIPPITHSMSFSVSQFRKGVLL